MNKESEINKKQTVFCRDCKYLQNLRDSTWSKLCECRLDKEQRTIILALVNKPKWCLLDKR